MIARAVTGFRQFLCVSIFVALILPISAHSEDDLTVASADLLFPYQAEILTSTQHNSWIGFGERLIGTLSASQIDPFLTEIPKITVVESTIPNAIITSNMELRLSTGLLKLVRSDAEYAFVLAHELAHLILGHVERRDVVTPEEPQDMAFYIEREVAADRLAQKILKRANFDAAAALSILTRVGTLKDERGDPLALSYPSLAARLSELKLVEVESAPAVELSPPIALTYQASSIPY